MNILWFTTRKMNDLCSTTMEAFGLGLVSRGHQVTIINSDSSEMHSTLPWIHVSIQVQAMRGRKASVLGTKMRQWLKEYDCPKDTVAIVDWQIAAKLAKSLQMDSIPWVLMDRSPPADSGILALLQWPVWKKAWKLVARKNACSGHVVSQTHLQFVQSKVKVDPSQIEILPAGVDIALFQPKEKNNLLTMVYHGRLDRHRGILALPMLQQKLRNENIETQLLLIGEGDAFQALKNMSQNDENLDVIGTLPQEELAQKIAKAHIGLLPMPRSKVWALASPLKRSEYAASGLMIFGIDHKGHRLETKEQPEWMKLVHQEDFHIDGVEWIQALTDDEIRSHSIAARKYAEEHLDWSQSVSVLEKSCISALNE